MRKLILIEVKDKLIFSGTLLNEIGRKEDAINDYSQVILIN